MIGVRITALFLVAAAIGQPAQAQLTLGRAVRTIGNESEEGPELFGTIRLAAIASDRRVFVLDASDNSIRVFDGSGRHQGSVGRTGRGPGDLGTPLDMKLVSGDRLLVADRVNGILEFDVSGAEPKFRTRWALGQRSHSICEGAGRLYVAGWDDSSLVRRVSRGQEVAAFGRTFVADTHPAIVSIAQRSPVLLSCRADGELLAVAQSQGPVVRLYSGAGELLREITIPDYEGVRYFVQARPVAGVVTVMPKHSTMSLHFLGENQAYLLVQVEAINRLPGGSGRARRVAVERSGIRSFLFEVASGRRVELVTNLPFLAATAHGLALEIADDPFPAVRVRPFSVGRPAR